ncbi:guanine nucleotide binding protein, alpha subunit [Mycena vulgaris]|nr:guanine nucleotide binding protein, alpha subunit [Mycena vulgaris]
MVTRAPMRSLEDSDPIAAAMAPPSNESPEERQRRIQNERAAKQVSDDIDEQLLKERQLVKRQPRPVKILLLGQSESGKSTTLKNFQLMYEPKAFRAERASWRAIIQLNVIRSFRIILEALARAASALDLPPSPHSTSSSGPRESFRPDADLLALRARLLPLLQVEDILVRRIATSDGAHSCTPLEHAGVRPDTPTGALRRTGKEVAVNSGAAWKRVFMRDQTGRESVETQHLVDWDDPDDPGRLLHARGEDMQRLWAHPTVGAVLERQGIRLQESSGFFLDSLAAVTAPHYVPTDDDILRARLKTLGVSEHRIRLSDPQGGITRFFHIYDVGGAKSLPAKWVPYFDDTDSIIFLAPISAFDQALAEDPRVNRLADSLDLWTSVVSNKLLEKTNLILFLNKVDILQSKLASGIRLVDFYPAYGLRPNDYDSASRYLRKQFNAILKQSSPSPRMFYCHLTNAIVGFPRSHRAVRASLRHVYQDLKSTTYVLAGIKDMLMRVHLKESYLIL